MTQYETVFGRPPFNLLSYIRGQLHNLHLIKNYKLEIKFREMKMTLYEAPNRMKQQADKHRTSKIFELEPKLT